MARLKERILNTTYLMSSKVLRPLFSFFLIMNISRQMGIAAQGQYATIFSIGIVFEFISTFAIKSLLVKEVAKQNNAGQKIFLHGLALVFPIAFLCIIVMDSLIFFWGGYQAIITYSVLIFSLSLPGTAFNDCAEGVLIGYEKTRFIGIIGIIENISRVAVCIIFIRLGYDVMTLFIIYAVMKYGISLFYAANLLKIWRKWKFSFDKNYYVFLMMKSRAFALSAVFVTVYWRADTIMLSKLKGDVAVGIYDGAYRFFSVVNIAIANVVISLLPVISEKFHVDVKSFILMSKKMIKYFLCVAIPGTAAIIISAKFLINILNPELVESVKVLNVLALTIISYGVTEILAHVFIASDNKPIDTAINGIGMVANITLNFILIPALSYYGAALATFFSINIYLVLQLFFIKKKLNLFAGAVRFNNVLRFALCVTVLAFFLILGNRLHTYYYSIPGLFIYFYLIWRLKVISTEDRAFFTSMIRQALKR